MTKRETLSQAVNGRGVTAEIYYDEGPEVQVKIVGNAGYGAQSGWRIRGRASEGDNTYYCEGDQYTTEGTFTGVNGKTYMFQAIYGTQNAASQGVAFTVNFGSGGDPGGDSGGGGGTSGGTYRFYFTEGDGTSLLVRETWDQDTGNHYRDIVSGEIIVLKDYFDVFVKALDGYKDAQVEFDNFYIEGEANQKEEYPDYDTTWHGTMILEGNITATSSATLMSYTLSISAGTGSKIAVSRVSSRKSDAALGVLTHGATIYHHDVLQIDVSTDAGYNAEHSVEGATLISDNLYTVSGPTTVKATAEVKSYDLELVSDGGATITINRTNSPLKGAAKGNIASVSNGDEQTYEDKIYYADVLQINFTYSADRKSISQVVNEEHFVSGNTITVDGDVRVAVTTELSGVVHIFDGSSFNNYIIQIFNGSTWDQYIPYVFDGTNWNICS